MDTNEEEVEITTDTIAAKLTIDEYEWFSTHEYVIGMGIGRKQMKDEILSYLKHYSGELFSGENDSDAEFVRDLRKLIMEKIAI